MFLNMNIGISQNTSMIFTFLIYLYQHRVYNLWRLHSVLLPFFLYYYCILEETEVNVCKGCKQVTCLIKSFLKEARNK